MLVPLNMPSPGPAKYEFSKPFEDECPKAAVEPLLSHGGRHKTMEDKDQPGPGTYDTMHRPNFSGLKKFVGCTNAQGAPSTFGSAKRFPKVQGTSSPSGEMYYAHSKQLTEPADISEDVMKHSRSCSLGVGKKIDLTNPYNDHRSQVSPATYHTQGFSTIGRTSPLDGFLYRSPSPTLASSPSRGASLARSCRTRERQSPTTSTTSPK